jgi:type II secretory pathway pseudopilin PulG
MRTRAQSEDGFLMVELVAAVVIISIALLALLGAYSLGYFAINSSGQTTQAGLLANNQLELYAAIPYASIGLDATTLASVKSTDPYYSTDEAALPGSGSDVTISGCGSSAQCSPVQTITGGDHKTYKLETFIRMIANPSVSGTNRTEKIITVLVRNMSNAGAKVVTMQTGFDSGLAS